MSAEDFYKKTQAFAQDGGGNRVVTAVTRDAGRAGLLLKGEKTEAFRDGAARALTAP